MSGRIGDSAPRGRDVEFVTGRARYVADHSVADEVWLRVVRSPVAHARLDGVGIDAARMRPVSRGKLEAQGTEETGWARDRRVDFHWE